MTDRYQFWFDALEGKVPVANVDDPQCGYFRVRAKKGGNYLPVAIWDDGGETKCLVGGQERDAKEIWNVCNNRPITEEVYTAVMEGRPWPDESEAVTASLTPKLSNSQAPDEREILNDQLESAAAGIEKFKDIKTDEELAQAQSLRSRLLELGGEADKKREALKRPHLDASKAIDKAWMPLVNKGKEGADAVRLHMNAYTTRKLNEKKAEEARKQEEERKLAAPADDATATTTQEPAPSSSPAPTAPLEGRKVKGAYGRGTSTKIVKVVSGITDPDALFKHVWGRSDKLREMLTELAQKAVNAGETVPGVRVVEEEQVR